MNYGLYCAYLGMRARQERLDQIASNIANSSTTGFKADRLQYRSAEAAGFTATEASGPTAPAAGTTTAAGNNEKTPLRGGLLTTARYGRDVAVVTGLGIDFSPGAIRETGRPLDVALGGEGFFVIQTPRGERYARAGNFTLDESGQLVTHNGDLVVGQSGPITVPPGNVNIGNDGTISVNGQLAGQLKLAKFASPATALMKEGNSLFMATGSEQASEMVDGRVVQGALEMSNVNPLTEMVAMMRNTREFDSLQRSATTLMNDLGRTIANELGKI